MLSQHMDNFFPPPRKASLTTQTDPRSAIKRQPSPTDLAQFLLAPAFRSELICVLSVKILAPMQCKEAVDYLVARRKGDGTVAVLAAAVGDGGVLVCAASISVQRGIEAKDWVV
jgi:hypothetical protein